MMILKYLDVICPFVISVWLVVSVIQQPGGKDATDASAEPEGRPARKKPSKEILLLIAAGMFIVGIYNLTKLFGD